MADSPSPDSEPTTRTLLRRVLDTADVRSPRRRRSARNAIQRTVLETLSSRRLGSQTKTSARRHSHGARSIGRLDHVQASAYLEKDTPRTLLKNILLTAPESSIVRPNPVVKLVPLSHVQSYRQESSQGSLDLQLPELDPPTTLASGLPASGQRKQRLRLSMFQQEVNQGLPLSQEPPGNADSSSFTRSLNLTFTTPPQPQSVRRPGLARRPPTRRAVDVGALLQDLQDNSMASASPGDSLRIPVATQPMNIVFEDTQPFSQPLVSSFPSVHHSLPHPPHTGVEDAERTLDHRTQSSGLELQGHMSRTVISELQPQLPEVTEAAGSKETMVAKEPEGYSEDQDTFGGPASPEFASNTPELLQAKQPHEFLELLPPPAVAVSPSEPLEPVPARLPSRPQVAGPRLYRDPYKTGLSHYVKLFSFYAKMPMEKKALEMVEKSLDKYFQHLCNDLEVFAAHAGRKTVKPEDLELLLRRQGLVTDEVSMHVLVERHLPMEYRQLLIPCASSGNSVFPAQ